MPLGNPRNTLPSLTFFLHFLFIPHDEIDELFWNVMYLRVSGPLGFIHLSKNSSGSFLGNVRDTANKVDTSFSLMWFTFILFYSDLLIVMDIHFTWAKWPVQWTVQNSLNIGKPFQNIWQLNPALTTLTCPKSLLALPCCDFFLQNQKVLPKDVMFNKLVLQDGELPRHPLVGFWQSLLHPKMLRESRFKVWTYWLRSLWKHLFVPRYYTPGPLLALFWVVSFLWTFCPVEFRCNEEKV